MSAAPSPSPELARLHRLFDIQRAAFAKEMSPSRAVRDDRLRRLNELATRHAAAFVEAIAKDFGTRPAFETLVAEVDAVAIAVRHARRHLRSWMRPRRVATAPAFWPGSGRIVRQPLGVVGIISPWNYPLYLCAGPLVEVLAAGNRALIKPSEVVPAVSELLRKAVAELFAEEEVAVVTGGPDVAQELAALPLDHLLFTGSTAVGRLVAQAAARNLTPVTLELGGKSPVIVDASADFGRAVPRITWGKLFNAGQTCIAPDYALVPGARLDEFAAEVRRTAARFYPAPAADPAYTSIVNDRHFTRLTGLLEDARGRGARVVEVAPEGSGADAASRKIPPTLVLGADASMRVMQEEIFGPILPVVGYEALDDALRFVNGGGRPLALYWFGTDRARRDEVLARTISGGVTVNDCMLHIVQGNLPFGGVGPSGTGAYHGEHGFRRFSHERAVFTAVGRFGGSFLFHPPVGRLGEWGRRALKALG